MNKKIFFFLTILALSLNHFSQTQFGLVNNDGLGTNNGSIKGLKQFKGKLYVGFAYDHAEILSSSTGDPNSFTSVYTNSNFESAGKFAVSTDGVGYLFAGMVGKSPNGSSSKVIRTSDGVNWEDYFELPAGTFSGLNIVSINVFKGTGAIDSVYIAYTDDNGYGHVVRNAIDASDFANSATWPQVLDLNAQFASTGSIMDGEVFNGKLYYSTYDNKLFESADGHIFTENTNYFTQMGGGRGLNVSRATSMEVYSNELFLGTFASNGAQLWKTADGVTFDSLYTCTSSLVNQNNLTNAGGKLWIIADDDYGYFVVQSYNGDSVAIENNNEFGTLDIESTTSALAEFNNHLYIGVRHFFGGKRLAHPTKGVNRNSTTPNHTLEMNSNGSQLWRTCLVGPTPNVLVNNGVDTSICPGASINLIANPGFISYNWVSGQTSQSISTNTTGTFGVTVADALGCRNTAWYTINNAPIINTIFKDSASNSTISPIIVCKGNTTPTLLASPEIDSYALQMSTADSGFVTPGSTAFASRQITIELWINPSSNSSGMICTEYDLGGTWSLNNNDLIEYYGGSIYLELPGMGETYIGGVPLNQWSHIVLRYDGNNLSGLINGSPSGGVTGTWSLPDCGSDAFKFGHTFSHGVGSPGTMNGKIKDVRIWNSFRSDTDIQNNMNGLAPGTYPDLIYHYMLNEGSGTTANDISGNGNNSVSLAGVFVTPQPVTITPAAGTINLGNNYYKFNPLQTTTYSASYTNTYGCTINTSFQVNVPKVDFTGSLPAVCGGVDATIYTATAGSYTFTPGVIDANPYFTPTPQPTVPTWYYASGFSTNGNCAISDSILINVGPTFASNVGNPPPVTPCEESDATITVLASGGTAPFTYFWQKNSSTDTTYTDTLTFYAGSINSTVSVTGVDGIGCPLNPPATFNINPIVSSTLTGHVTTPPPTVLNVDNGLVYVFKHQPGNAGLDTIGYASLDANGEYFFPGLYAGSYLIKALPNETAFPLAVPTYYGNAFQWDSSLVYTHGCVQNDTANIQIVVASLATGTASVSGYINEDTIVGMNRIYNIGLPNTPFAPGGPLKGIDVKLGKNPGGGIQARTTTDSSGFYQFVNVPDGGYKVYVDIPNLPMDSTRELVINPGDSSIQNNYFVDSARIYVNADTINPVGIYSSAKMYENKFSIYPNPAKDVLYISYELAEDAKVGFEISNMYGATIKAEPIRKYPEGKNIFIFNVGQLHLSGGVYFISILNENKKYTQRVVVIE